MLTQKKSLKKRTDAENAFSRLERIYKAAVECQEKKISPHHKLYPLIKSAGFKFDWYKDGDWEIDK